MSRGKPSDLERMCPSCGITNTRILGYRTKNSFELLDQRICLYCFCQFKNDVSKFIIVAGDREKHLEYLASIEESKVEKMLGDHEHDSEAYLESEGLL